MSDRASPATARFLAAAEARGLEVDVHTWPQGTRTAQDAARAVGCRVDQIVKSLVFVADGEPVVVLTSGANRVDISRLAAAVDAESARKADAAEAREATGYAIGGTPPLGHATPLRIVMDPALLDHREVWAAAGTPDTTFPTSPEKLRDASGAIIAEIAES
jgi:prolyl-tRNA editing enzyme YbaK/EbsC (Cys-tRNA(Pro) deacylase)